MTSSSDRFPLDHNERAAMKAEMNPIQEHKNDHPIQEDQKAGNIEDAR